MRIAIAGISHEALTFSPIPQTLGDCRVWRGAEILDQPGLGAAVLLENGDIFTGCNVENASYGLTNCAERSAIFAAVSKLGGSNVKIRAVAVVNDHDAACSPCGACRQVIAEFGPEAILWYQGRNGIQESTMEHLLPDCFRL